MSWFFVSQGFAQSVSVTPATTSTEVQNYVENVLLGSCVTASNITYVGATEAAATFDGNGTVLGLNGGILLTSGQAIRAVGPDNSNSSGFSHGLTGDPDLTDLANNFTTYDASILEFDFVPQSDTLRFNYIFGSEEYPEYVNSGYNDVFGFFISGPGISGPYTNGAENIALLPGSSTVVAIDNINNGYSSSEPATGPCTNCAFYVDNSSGVAVQYDGHTTVLTAQAIVTPCETYHIKLAIADAGDGALDSGVFLEEGSFSASGTDPVELTTVSGVVGVPEGCNIGTFVFRRLQGSSNSSAVTVGYNVSGTATPGVDYTALPGSITIPAGQDSVILNVEGILDFTPEGPESIVLDLFGGGCSCTAPPSVSMDILDNDVQLSLTTSGTTTICLGESANLSANPAGSVLPYTSGWDNGAPAGNNVTVSPTQTTTYTFSVEDACAGQSLTSSETITVITPDFTVDDGSQCLNGNTFNFQNTGTSGATVTHFWDFGDGNSSTDENPSYTYTAAGVFTVEHQVIYTAANCTASATGIMNVYEDPTAVITVVQDISCAGGANGELTASTVTGTAPFGYTWTPTSQITATISGLDQGTYNVIITDDNGCSSSASETLTQSDTELPIALCQNAVVQLETDGSAAIVATLVDNGSSDNCGIASLVVSPNFFDCSLIGPNAVTLTVTDINGNVATCNATVSVEDTIVPNAVCQDVSVSLDGNGTATVNAVQVDDASTDNCAVQSVSLSPSSFTCADVGANAVELTVTDVNGSVSSCNAIVTVFENINPIAICQDITVNVDVNGSITVTGNQVGSGSTDNCAVVSIDVIPNVFNCSDIGINTAVVTVTDGSGNTDNCNANITVGDILAPNALCQNASVYLDVSGNASVLPTDIDNGSNDNCAVLNLSVDPNSFACADVGLNPVQLTVFDVNGNQSSCAANVNVLDTIAPAAACQDISIQLDANGNATVTAAQVDDGSIDNCSSVSISVTPNSFDCTVASPAFVTLTVTDDYGNSSTCQSTVSLTENANPTAVCQDIIVQLDASGNTSISPSDVDGGSSDNCGITNLSVNPSMFDCSNIGQNTVTLVVEDANATADSCAAIVTVQENVNPIAVCQDATVYLDPTGNVIAPPSLVDGGSADNCAVDSLSLAPNTFSCAEIGTNAVQLTVFDASGNLASCSAEITVLDTVSPIANCQNATIQLGANGIATITPAQIDNSSTDACGVVGLSLDVNAFDCSSPTPSVILLTVEDSSGNLSTCSSSVIIDDVLPPSAICQNATVYLDDNGVVSVDPADFDNGSTDNCNVANLSVSPSNFDCSDIGQELITFMVEDASGNLDSCIAVATILDTISPQILNCPDDIVLNPDSSNCQPSITWTEPTASDNCTFSLTSNFSSGDAFPAGSTQVTYSAEDQSGNTSTCSFNVEVQPSQINVSVVADTFNCGFNISCNGSADGVATASVTGGCEPYSFAWSNGQSANPAINLGAGEHIVIVTDANGNQNSDTITLSEPPPLSTDDLSSPTYPGGANLSCAGAEDGSVQLEVSGGSDCQQYSFDWTGPNGFTEIQKDITDLEDGTYIVAVTDANGCEHVDSIIITAPTEIQLALFPNTYNGFSVSCFGAEDGLINLEVSGGNPTYSYSWSNGETTQDIDSLPVGVYSVLVTDASGCVADTSIELNSPTQIDVFATSTSPIVCFGENNGGAVVDATGGVPNYSYLWSNGDADASLNQVGQGTYQVVVTDGNGCQDSLEITLTEPPQLLVSVDQIENTTCFNGNDGSITISASSGTPGYQYLWQPTLQSTPSAINLLADDYIYTVTDANGCAVSDTVSVLEPDQIIVSTSEDTTVCPRSLIELNATATGGGGTHLINWNNGLHFGETYNTIIQQTTNYTIVAEDQFGCQSEPATVLVTTLNNVSADFDFDVLTPCASPFEVDFTNTSQNAVSFEWAFANGTSSFIENPTTAFDTSGANEVTLIVLSNEGCTDTLATNINIDNLPQAAFNIPFPDGCFPIMVGHFNQSSDANTYFWDFGDGETSAEGSPYHFYSEPGAYTVTLIATNQNGCSDTLTVDTAVYAYPRPIADFIPIQTEAGNEFILNNTSVGAQDYFWFFGNGEFSEDFEPNYAFPEFGGYDIILTASNEFGCEDTALYSVEVPLDYGLFVPNAMVIGEPGAAGEFIPIGTGLASYQVWIFDLWGNEIWQSNALVNGSPAEGWDGRYNGVLVPQGSYSWKIVATFKNGVQWEGMAPKNSSGNPSTVGSVTVLH